MAVANPTDTSTPSSSPVEWLSPSVSRQWLMNNRVVVFSVTDAKRESVDKWAEACKTAIANWPPDQPVLLMHDLSARGLALTPYARERAQDIAKTRPEARGRVAVILSSSLAATLIQLFLRSERETPRTHRAFASREKGLAWLLGA